MSKDDIMELLGIIEDDMPLSSAIISLAEEVDIDVKDVREGS